MEPGLSSAKAFFGREDSGPPALIAVTPGAWSPKIDRALVKLSGWKGRAAPTDSATFLASLSPRKRARLRSLVGPDVLGLARHLPGARTVAVVRDPVDLVATDYYDTKAEGSLGRPEGEELLELLAGMPLDRVYEQFAGGTPESGPAHRLWAAYCNRQARMLLATVGDPASLPFTPGPPPEARIWRRRLAAAVDGVDTIARHEALEPMIAEMTGSSVAAGLLRQGDALGVGTAQLLPAARSAVRAYNWLDLELYARAEPERPKRVPSRRRTDEQWVRVGGRRVELLFDAGERAEGHPVGVFQHLHKTGGSSLKRLVRDALPGATDEWLWTPLRAERAATVAEWYRDLAAELEPGRLATLRFVMSHSANFLLPHLGGDAVAACLVRDAVDRVISHYAFLRRPDPDGIAAGLAEVFATYGGASPRDSRRCRKQRIFFNHQARVLLAPELDVDELAYTAGPSPDADRWRAALFATAERYVMGTTECFHDAARRIGAATGVEVTGEIYEKVNRDRPRVDELDRGLVEVIRSYNWLDDELHNHVRHSVIGHESLQRI